MLSDNQRLTLPNSKVSLYLKREDRIHPAISGNKYRKLKYNLIEARSQNQDTLLTFGGAFSNHIAAVAAAGKEFGFKTIGVIRGEELYDKISQNPTLLFARDCGMKLHFLSRAAYSAKSGNEVVKQLTGQFGEFYLLPEGGTNELAIKGCEEILTDEDSSFDYICCAVGTGGTIAGIINSAADAQLVLGFPALKGFLTTEIEKLTHKCNWKIIEDYHFGGYGKITTELIAFINDFRSTNKIPLDPVYTAKMLYGILDLIEKNYFPEGSKILAIHTGGLQGIAGMNMRLQNKNLHLIDND